MAKRNPTLYLAFGLTKNQFQERGIPGKKGHFSICLISAYGDGIGKLKTYKDPNKFMSTAINYLGIARDFRIASILKRSYNPGFKQRSKEIVDDYAGNLYPTLENVGIAVQNAARFYPKRFKEIKGLKKDYWNLMMGLLEMEPRKARLHLEGREDVQGILKPLGEIDPKTLTLEQKYNFKKLLSKSLDTPPSTLTRTKAWSKHIDKGTLNVKKLRNDFEIPLYVAKKTLEDLVMAGYFRKIGKEYYPNSCIIPKRKD